MNTTSKLVKWIQIKHPSLVKDMMNCSHHSATSLNPYHLEGDVWSHLLLVLSKAEQFDELTQFALLCHDLAKPRCRTESEGMVRFKGHELYSAYMSIPLSLEYGFNKEESLKIFKLIAYHTALLKKVEYDDTQSTVINQHVGHPGLFLDLLNITKADGLGRIMNNYSERLHFIDDYYSGALYTMLNNPRIKKQNQPQLNCMIGLPASGKSTYLIKNKINRELIIERDSIADYNKISLGSSMNQRDKNLILSLINEKKEKLVQDKKDIYIDMVNLVDRDRHSSLKNIPRNYWFKAIIFIEDLSKTYDKNNKREKKVPLDYYDYILKNSSLPLFDEFDEIEFIMD